jgi:hypothetical protein
MLQKEPNFVTQSVPLLRSWLRVMASQTALALQGSPFSILIASSRFTIHSAFFLLVGVDLDRRLSLTHCDVTGPAGDFKNCEGMLKWLASW